MSRVTKCLAAFAMLLCATPSFAGYLAGDSANAYFDGVTQWAGSTPYSDGFDLIGYVEWAVYAPGDFPASFTGYSPSAGELTYTYQLFETGPAALSYFQVALGGSGDNISYFTGSGASASIDGATPATADITSFVEAVWTFGGVGGHPLPGTPSKGLVFSSPMVPIDGLGIMQDGGPAAFSFPIPSPSEFYIPEPATWTMAVIGLASLTAVSFRRRRRSVRV
jgi:PEP-CTERM motif